jgi:hypothetical protein
MKPLLVIDVDGMAGKAPSGSPGVRERVQRS